MSEVQWGNAGTAVEGRRSPGDLLAPRTDLDALAATFAARGRVQVPDVLDAAFARELRECLRRWPRWARVTRIGGEHRDFDAAAMDALDAERRQGFDALVSADARQTFQYLYDRHPVHDVGFEHAFDEPALQRLQALLQDAAFLDLARSITGSTRIAFADGQMTRYRAGHYLTLHDDHADGKHRIAAYVLGLTDRWTADFGGQLQFLDAQGRVTDVFTPAFNTLSLFAVPAPHLVTAVAPFVAEDRLSVTGWLRAAGPI